MANELHRKIPPLTGDEQTRGPASGIVPLKAAITDQRGTIQPVVDMDMKSCELITSRAGTVRGNHYHVADWHFCYVLSGSTEYYHRPFGSKEAPERVIIRAGQLFFTPAMVEHAMVFPEDSVVLMLRRFPREPRDVVGVNLIERRSPA